MVFKTIGNLDSARYDLGSGIFNGHLYAIGGYSTSGATPVAIGTMVKAKAGNGGSIAFFKSGAPPFTALGNLKSFLYNNFVFVGAGNSTNASNALNYSGLVATMTYKSQTGNFTVGDVITGGTSAATAVILSDVDGGATGTLTLNTITGTFTANETITDQHTGSAAVNVPVHGTFTVGKTITGGTSAATAVIASDTNHGNATGTLTLTSISGTFVTAETITDAAGVSGSATTVGGVVLGGQVPGMLSGQIQATGQISKWTPVASPAELINYQMWGFRNWLYIAGGTTAAVANNTNVYRAEINGDGTLGAWSTIGTLPAACVKNTNVTTVQGNVINMVVDGNVWSATLSAGNGQVSLWTLTPMITSLNAPAVLRTGNTLIAIGGKNGGGTTLMNTYYVRLNAAGVPQSDWQAGSNLVTARSAHAIAVDGQALWVMGGLDSSGTPLASVEFCIISGNQVP